ncbi:DNA-binding protein [Alicyclobacillus hesperidum subsp. aegles]|uniref:HU family DNA-binding protein n=1 Tax=Alicyclobacillus TaxID=29330 RepID=UPI00118FEAFB|nr:MULTISPECIES: HU family DNA-binding protein [Alicyclobacillus]GEO27480.1 DNA-binding protein [Alicyclobacillus acidoterrestris]GLG02541.1 DNA-binding protein [Alicyclobacillus hesperidum subsp. aegles]
MNKTELIKSIAVGANVPQGTAAKMLQSLQDAVTNAITHGDKVSIRGFGSFAISDHAARRCRHPVSGEVMQAKAYRTIRFVPAAQIKSQLN